MKKYGVNELRRMYLEFFESKDHLKMNSFSLVPHNDNSLLLINAGMAPLTDRARKDTKEKVIKVSFMNVAWSIPVSNLQSCFSVGCGCH